MGKGLFVVIDGIDGSGKSSIARMLAEHLEDTGLKPELTHEPTDLEIGGHAWGKHARATCESETELDVQDTENLLGYFTRDRRMHVQHKIQPWLNRGKTVICNRYYYSTAAYQGLTHAVGQMSRHPEGIPENLSPTRILQAQMREFPTPDLAIILTCPPKVALARIQLKRDLVPLYEVPEKLCMIQYLFRQFGPLCPEVCMIDGLPALKDVFAQVLRAVDPVMKANT